MASRAIFSKNQKTSTLVVTVLVMMFIAGFFLWLILAPVVNGSFVFWSGIVLMVIPGFIAAESLGSLGLDSNFTKKMPKTLRIIFGVLWVIICLLLFSLVLAFLSSMVGK